jgi:DNA-binding transcriptional ArsR family regulator
LFLLTDAVGGLCSIVLNYGTIELRQGVVKLISMKPLVHPSVEDITVEGILHALSDPTRVEIFSRIADSGCSASCSTFLTVGEKAVPKSTLSQHFKVLRDAGLVRSLRVGVEMQNSSRCQEIDKRFPGLLAAIVGALKAQAGEREVAQAPARQQRTKSKGKAKDK